MIRTIWGQRKRFINAQLSVPFPDPKRRPLTPPIKDHQLHALGVCCRIQILSGQTPQMFIDATELLANAFDVELEVRRVDQRHVDIIFLLREPLSETRNAGFTTSASTFNDVEDDNDQDPPTTYGGLW